MRTPWRAAMRAMPVRIWPELDLRERAVPDVAEQLLEIALERRRGPGSAAPRGPRASAASRPGTARRRARRPSRAAAAAGGRRDPARRPCRSRGTTPARRPSAGCPGADRRGRSPRRGPAGSSTRAAGCAASRRASSGCRLAHADADDLLHHEQAPGRELEVDARGVEAVEAGEQRADALDARRLDREVELAAQRLGEVARTPRAGRRRARTPGGCRPSRANSSSSARSSRICRSAVGRCTLSTTRRAVGQRRAVHLRDRAGRERLGLDVRERVLPGHAELALEHRHDLGLRRAAACRPAGARARRCTREAAGRAASRAPGRASRTSGRAPRAPRAGGARGLRRDGRHAARGGRRRGRSRPRGRAGARAAPPPRPAPSRRPRRRRCSARRATRGWRRWRAGTPCGRACRRPRARSGRCRARPPRARSRPPDPGSSGSSASTVELRLEAVGRLARPGHRATARLGHGEDPCDGHRRDSARSRTAARDFPAASGLLPHDNGRAKAHHRPVGSEP